MASKWKHYYFCDVCSEHYAVIHTDDMLYVDPCPGCNYEDNEPKDIVEHRDA
jgi:hypothetical protein